MRTVYPSRLTAFLQSHFAGHDRNHHAATMQQKIGALVGFVELFKEIPDELIILEEGERAELLAAVAKVEFLLDLHRYHSPPAVLDAAGTPLNAAWRLLEKLPDRVPSAQHDLAFITDDIMRLYIGLDLAAVANALQNGEWKGATILAASCAEALLLHGLQRIEAKSPGSVDKVGKTIKWLGPKPEFGALEDKSWSMYSYTLLSKELGLIGQNTAKELEPTKDYRNLIHPARAVREKSSFDRGTAYVAVGALDHVVSDLRRSLANC